MNSFMLFFAENPLIWVLIVAVIFLLFGGSKLPQLAKALGQSKRAFKEGLAESEREEGQEKDRKQVQAGGSPLATVDDEALFEEARRRERLQATEHKN